MYLWKKILNPEIFQGKYQTKNYSESWYFKHVDKTGKNAIAIIPGIFIGETPLYSHAFIQFIEGKTDKINYYKFNFDTFKYSEKTFEVSIGNNFFSKTHIELDLKNILQGELKFKNPICYPKNFLNPNIISPFTLLGITKSSNEILNLHHDIEGGIYINNTFVNFDNGNGYIEKNRGKSLPAPRIWIQSNNFNIPETSFMLSIYKSHWIGGDYMGFQCFLRTNNKYYLFASFTEAKIVRLQNENSYLSIVIQDNNYLLHIQAINSKSNILKMPHSDSLNNVVLESITGVVDLELYNKSKKLIYKGTGSNTSMEISGNINQFITQQLRKDIIVGDSSSTLKM